MIEEYENAGYQLNNYDNPSDGDDRLMNFIIMNRAISVFNTFIKGNLGVYNLYQWMNDGTISKKNGFSNLNASVIVKNSNNYLNQIVTAYDTFSYCNTGVCLRIDIPNMVNYSAYCHNGFTEFSIIGNPMVINDLSRIFVTYPISNMNFFNLDCSYSPLQIKEKISLTFNNAQLKNMISQYMFFEQNNQKINNGCYPLNSFQSYIDKNNQPQYRENFFTWNNSNELYFSKYNSAKTQCIIFQIKLEDITTALNTITSTNTRLKLQFQFNNQNYDVLDAGFDYNNNGCQLNTINCIENYFSYPSTIDPSLSNKPIVDYIIDGIESINSVGENTYFNGVYQRNYQWYNMTYWLDIFYCFMMALEIPTILDALDFSNTDISMKLSQSMFIGYILNSLIQGVLSVYFIGLLNINFIEF